MECILYVDDEQENLLAFETYFRRYYKVFTTSSTETAREILNRESIDLVLADQRMPTESGVELLRYALENFPKAERLLVTGYSDMEAIIQAINHAKVFYYVTKPWDSDDFKIIISRAIEARKAKLNQEKLLVELQEANKQLQQKASILTDANEEIKKLKARLEVENQYLKKEVSRASGDEEIVYRGKVYEDIIDKIKVVAPTSSTVLITGETGTGKELLARAVHRWSTRRDKNFIKLNCAAIPSTLIESELFGHMKGSFTGALNNKVGLFELADKGTIFLDEIGELPIELQPKLLRVLQDGEFNRIGDTKTMTVDVRVIAATNRDLERGMQDGEFRSDLFFRLNVFPIHNPSLSERKDDIPALVEHFIKKISRKIGKSIHTVPDETVKALKAYNWPGNIRELENFVERAIILSTDGELKLNGWQPVRGNDADEEEAVPAVGLRDREKNHIIQVLEMVNWKIRGKGGAAEALNLPATTLYYKMKKMGIPFKKPDA